MLSFLQQPAPSHFPAGSGGERRHGIKHATFSNANVVVPQKFKQNEKIPPAALTTVPLTESRDGASSPSSSSRLDLEVPVRDVPVRVVPYRLVPVRDVPYRRGVERRPSDGFVSAPIIRMLARSAIRSSSCLIFHGCCDFEGLYGHCDTRYALRKRHSSLLAMHICL